MVLTVSGLGTAAGAAAAPYVNVAPRTGLVDYQRVTVAGHGFSANAQIATVECRSGALAEGDCDLGTLVYHRVDAQGKFSFQRYVRRIISVGGTTVDCARPAGCIMGAGNISNLKQASGRTIFFNPNVPPKVAKLTVTPRTGLADHQLVTVSGTGFQPSATIYISQCVSGTPSQRGPCDYATQRYLRVNSHGAFTASNFVLERRQLNYVKGVQKRLDCADAPGRCDIRAVAGGIGISSAQQPRVPLGFDPNKKPAIEKAHLSPTTQFVDLQSVDVTGTGFTPGYSVNIVECSVTTPNNLNNPDACDYTTAQTVTAGFQGELDTAFFMRRKISNYTSTGPGVVDCAAKAGACELLLAGSPSQPNTTIPLTFNAAVAAVPPSVSASPDTGLTNGQRVTVTVGGFTPDHPVQLVECSSDAVTEVNTSYCDYATASVTTPGGPTGQATFVVRRVVRTPDGIEDCRAHAGACVLVAIGSGSYYGGYDTTVAVPHKVGFGTLPNTASTPLTFAP